MNWHLSRGPVDANAEPISLATAKLHLKVDASADDALILTHISTARQSCEDFTNRALAVSTYTWTLDAFPCGSLCLPVGVANLVVNAIAYTDTSGSIVTLANTAYRVLQRQNARPEIAPVYGTVFPPSRIESDAVTVTFTAATAPVDAKLIAGMLLTIGWLYEYREPSALERTCVESLWSSSVIF